jgi:hypothetical protein
MEGATRQQMGIANTKPSKISRLGGATHQSPQYRITSNKPDALMRESSLSLEIRIQSLVKEMQEGIQRNRPVDLSTPPHREITEALHRMVYDQGDPAKLRVIYNDGTKGEPFPVRELWLPDSGLVWKPGRVLNIGTLTFRHVDYDNHVDIYLIRDRETRTWTNARVEMEAYKRMTEILSDPLLAVESYISIYQTGLEPLVVGMYRALVNHLIDRRENDLPQLCVQPVFFVADNKPPQLWG